MKDNWLSSPAAEQLTPFEAPASSGDHSPDRGSRSAHAWTRTGGWAAPESSIPHTVIFVPRRLSPSVRRRTLRH